MFLVPHHAGGAGVRSSGAGPILQLLGELVKATGAAPSSNVAQDLANALMLRLLGDLDVLEPPPCAAPRGGQRRVCAVDAHEARHGARHVRHASAFARWPDVHGRRLHQAPIYHSIYQSMYVATTPCNEVCHDFRHGGAKKALHMWPAVFA
eukprot:3472359-Pleurochrysis_carterae.AAC.1